MSLVFTGSGAKVVVAVVLVGAPTKSLGVNSPV